MINIDAPDTPMFGPIYISKKKIDPTRPVVFKWFTNKHTRIHFVYIIMIRKARTTMVISATAGSIVALMYGGMVVAW